MPAKILVIDDEESMRNFMEIMLLKEGYLVETASSGKSGISRIKDENYDLVITDLNMPEMSGIEVLKEIKSFKEDLDLIVVTAFASVDSAIEAMKQGAVDYITKPFKVDEIKLVIDKSIQRKRLLDENSYLKKQLRSSNNFDNFIGNSEPVIKLKKLVERVAASESTVLVRGESGVGKDLVSRAIHNMSPRKDGPFVSINCAALPETLLESELFGHIKGSFTGAVKDKDGLFMAADGGTFFLDEVGNTSLAIQVKLLKVLEEKKITPVGSTKPLEVDVRLIAATNSDLEDEVKNGKFRADLFYRLNVIPIYIPALKERRDDIELLVHFFLEKYCNKINCPVKEISEESVKLLKNYNWPGNVRELENTIERAVLLNRTDKIEKSDFPEKLFESNNSMSDNIKSDNSDIPLNPTLESIEKAYIHFVMTQAGGNKTKAAKILGIDPSTLYRKLDRYNLKEMFEGKSDG